MVLPDPVTPSSVWYRSPRRRPAVSSAMALGWSPAGSKGATTSKRGLLMGEIYSAGISSGSVSPGPGDSGRSSHGQQLFPLGLGHRNDRQPRLPYQRQLGK